MTGYRFMSQCGGARGGHGLIMLVGQGVLQSRQNPTTIGKQMVVAVNTAPDVFQVASTRNLVVAKRGLYTCDVAVMWRNTKNPTGYREAIVGIGERQGPNLDMFWTAKSNDPASLDDVDETIGFSEPLGLGEKWELALALAQTQKAPLEYQVRWWVTAEHLGDDVPLEAPRKWLGS